MKKLLPAILFLFLLSFIQGKPSWAQESLSPQQVERVKACKDLLEDVDKKPLRRTIDELEESLYPELSLQIMEAKAKTYADIVREQNVIKLKDKEWLYAMIALNMANLQFGGKVGGQDAALSRMITRKLKEYLPAEAMAHPGFSKSVE